MCFTRATGICIRWFCTTAEFRDRRKLRKRFRAGFWNCALRRGGRLPAGKAAGRTKKKRCPKKTAGRDVEKKTRGGRRLVSLSFLCPAEDVPASRALRRTP